MRWRAFLLLVSVVLFAACEDQTTPTVIDPPDPVSSPTGEDTRVIGLVGTMTGDDMWRGEDAFEGAHLAVNVLNRSVDEGRPPFELVTLDDEGDPARATELVAQLAGDGAVGVVYAGPPEGLPPAERALAEAGIPAVLCYGDLYSAQMLRPHIFQASPPFLWQARSIARYLLNDRDYRRVGVLVSRSLSGETALASIRSALGQTGSHLLSVAHYDGDEGAAAATRKLRKRRVDAVVVEGSPSFTEDVAIYLAGVKRHAPQTVGFDLGVSRDGSPIGTVASDTYARGAHFLPIPSFEAFAADFQQWWDGQEPLGWELRAYDAARMIGWAAQRTRGDGDRAVTLESLRGTRFGGLGITFGPDDHTAAEQTAIGLWVRPRTAFSVLVPSVDLPWLPLARGFSIDGERTSVLNRDWRHLFMNPPPPDGPAPKFFRMRYAVTSRRSDPIH